MAGRIFYEHFGEDGVEGFEEFGAFFVDGDGVRFFGGVIAGWVAVVEGKSGEIRIFFDNHFGGEFVGDGVVDDVGRDSIGGELVSIETFDGSAGVF